MGSEQLKPLDFNPDRLKKQSNNQSGNQNHNQNKYQSNIQNCDQVKKQTNNQNKTKPTTISKKATYGSIERNKSFDKMIVEQLEAIERIDDNITVGIERDKVYNQIEKVLIEGIDISGTRLAEMINRDDLAIWFLIPDQFPNIPPEGFYYPMYNGIYNDNGLTFYSFLDGSIINREEVLIDAKNPLTKESWYRKNPSYFWVPNNGNHKQFKPFENGWNPNTSNWKQGAHLIDYFREIERYIQICCGR